MAVAAVGVALALRDPATPAIDAEADGADPAAAGSEDGEAAAGDRDVDAAAIPMAEPCPPPPDDAPEPSATMYDAPPEADLAGADELRATLETTCGTIELALNAEAAPRTVSNFVALARDDYYRGSPFHRVIDGFMIQGGDPAGTGCGQPECDAENFDPDAPSYPGYTFEDELARAEELVADSGGYPRGTLAMANSGPDTSGSQFFIVQTDTALPPDYTVFGRAVDGLDVVDQIAVGPTQGTDSPVEPVVIRDVTIEEG